MENQFEEDRFVDLIEEKKRQEEATVINKKYNFKDFKKDNETSVRDIYLKPTSLDCLNFFVYSKEFVVEWVRKMSFRPTALTIICGTTIYFIAICSTVQRREGDRWLRLFLNGKMPGFHMLYQETSWETFENITHKHLTPVFEKKNKTEGELKNIIGEKDDKNFLITNLLDSNLSTKVHSSIHNLTSNPSSIPTQSLQGEEAKVIGSRVNPTMYGLQLSPIKKIDLYKDKALISLDKPFEKRIRKNFVGFYVKKQNLTHLERETSKPGVSNLLDQQNRPLPWYRIDSCNRYSRVILPKSDKKEKIDQASFFTKNSQNTLSDRITGLQYVFPFYKGKESVYTESDSIPFKLESPYSTAHVAGDKACLELGSSSLQNKERLTSLKEKLNTFSYLKDKKQKGSGKYVTNFQAKLQNLFYLYGVCPPTHYKEKTHKEILDVLSDSKIETLVNELCNNVVNVTQTSQCDHNAKKELNSSFGKWNLLERNNVMCARLMSGYKFPEYSKQETNSLFKKFVIPHLLISSWIDFSSFYLINQVVSRPFYIKLPPVLPFSFFTNLTYTLNRPASTFLYSKNSQESSFDFQGTSFASRPLSDSLAITKRRNLLKRIAKGSHLNITYKRLSLQELKEVKDGFFHLGKDYEDYLNLPKDSAPAIRISPSLEDDQSIKLEAEPLEKKDDEKASTFEQLQTLREREKKWTLGQKLRPFAYKNQLASQVDNFDLKKTKDENSWIGFQQGLSHDSYLAQGSKNLLNDRKFSFFGRKDLLTKRLIAQEQKNINEQLFKNSYQISEFNPQNKEGQNSVQGIANPKQVIKSESYRKLQRRARKGLIKLLGSLDFSARDVIGSKNRTQKPNPALRGNVIKSAYSHLRWQKKRFSSRLLGAPSKRHLIMPEITANDWKKMLEWQLRNYFFLEEERLQPLKKENPEKTFKIRQLNLYLPWVTIRTPLNKPYQWPLTRLDYAEIGLDCADFIKNNIEKKQIKRNHWGKKQAKQEPFQYPLSNRIFSESFYNYQLPEYNPIFYWDSGKGASLSTPLRGLKLRPTTGQNNKNGRISHLLTKNKSGSATNKKAIFTTNLTKPGFNTRKVTEPYLCEPLTNQSWLLIYRLFLVFALKNLLKYIYRISLKDFLIRMANSDFGLMVTSLELREWLEHAPQKSFYTPRKRLQDVVTFEDSISTLSYFIWYLRNSGRGPRYRVRDSGAIAKLSERLASTKHAGAHGLLLVGPAGAEKTSVVQAIAGECQVPVIVQSMNALTFTFDDPYERLEKVFKLARKQAPCVLFLDDLDAMGQSRAHVITNDVGAEDLLFSLDTYTAEGKLSFANLSDSLHKDGFSPQNTLSTVNNNGKKASLQHSSWIFNPLAENPVDQPNLEFLPEEEADQIESGGGQNGQNVATFQQNQELQTRKLNLLLRLLTEMDGISPLKGVVIVATSERPALLDPALVRAGRFERRIHLSLPNHEKRIQLFKRETQKIGHISSMPWEYLSLRTTNMSGADIVSAVNHSAIRAILDNTVHTIETLEHGLNCVVGLPNKKLSKSSFKRFQANIELSPNKVSSLFQTTSLLKQKRGSVSTSQPHDPLQTSRLAFYQAGKAVIYKVLIDLPPLGIVNLTELVSPSKPKNTIASLLALLSLSDRDQRSQSRRTRLQLETLLIGLYAGKAAELLHLSSNTIFASTSQERRSRSAFLQSKSKNREKLLFLQEKASKTTPLTSLKGISSSVDSIISRKDLSLNKTKTFGYLWQSNLGFSELLTASSLISLMITRWYLYSQKIFPLKINKVISSLNHEQIKDETLFSLAQRFSKELEFDLLKPTFWGINFHSNKTGSPSNEHHEKNELFLNTSVPQKRNKNHWWEAKVCQALEMGQRPYGKWYRIYLPKVEERELNEEWVPPDSIFHQSLTLSNLNTEKGYPFIGKRNTRVKKQYLTFKQSFKNNESLPSLKTLNDFYLFERDSSYQNAVLNSFYSAFNLLNDNRELLDLFADSLIRFQKLRSHEIEKICSFFFCDDAHKSCKN